MSVFDAQCAAVYLTEKTDVAFRPFGLDLFDKLAQGCKAVRAKLEGEQRSLAASTLTIIQPLFPEGTSVAKFLASVSSLTKPDAVQALANLSPEEEARFALLEKSLLDLQANDPEKLIKQLTLRAGRLQALVQHLKAVEGALSAAKLSAVFDARAEGRRKSEEAKRLREADKSRRFAATSPPIREREGHLDAYEKDAKHLYGLLREAWERALEEVLLGGLVERYRPYIQTLQVALIADITPEDCKAVEMAMTKCSQWLTGHDQAAAARAPIPGPAELKTDIDMLDDWVTTIRKRRQKGSGP